MKVCQCVATTVGEWNGHESPRVGATTCNPLIPNRLVLQWRIQKRHSFRIRNCISQWDEKCDELWIHNQSSCFILLLSLFRFKVSFPRVSIIHPLETDPFSSIIRFLINTIQLNQRRDIHTNSCYTISFHNLLWFILCKWVNRRLTCQSRYPKVKCFHGVGREESPYGYDICVVVRSEPPLSHRGSRGIDHASVDVRYGCGFGA